MTFTSRTMQRVYHTDSLLNEADEDSQPASGTRELEDMLSDDETGRAVLAAEDPGADIRNVRFPSAMPDDGAFDADGEETPPEDVQPPPVDGFVQAQIMYLDLLNSGKFTDAAAHLYKMRNDFGSDVPPSRERFLFDNVSIAECYSVPAVVNVARRFRGLLRKSNDFVQAWSDTSVNIEGQPQLAEAMFRLRALGPGRGDAARKFIAALVGGVQNAATPTLGPDLFVPTSRRGETGVWMGVRAGAAWRGVEVASWQLTQQDVDSLLDANQRDRLVDGAPIERLATRKRLVIDSLANALGQYPILFIVANADGTWSELCGLLGPAIEEAFHQGILDVTEDPGGIGVDSEGEMHETMRFALTVTSSEIAEDGSMAPAATLMRQAGDKLVLACDESVIEQFASATSLYFAKKTWPADPTSREIALRCAMPSLGDTLFKKCT